MKTTGRKFRCVGLKSIDIIGWPAAFTLGDVYPEMVHSSLTQDEEDGSLYLYSNIDMPLWVDASQFELVEEC